PCAEPGCQQWPRIDHRTDCRPDRRDVRGKVFRQSGHGCGAMTNVTRFRAGKADIGSPASHMILPHNIQVEQALLGAVLLNNNVLAGIPSLQPGHFFESFHGTIFDVARTMHAAGRAANPVTLKSALPAEHEIIHGLTLSEYLARLAAEATTTIQA